MLVELSSEGFVILLVLLVTAEDTGGVLRQFLLPSSDLAGVDFELASQYEVHPNQVHQWKKALTENAVGIFGGDLGQKKKDDKVLISQLYQQIGQLKVDKNFLEKGLGRWA